MAGVAVGGQKRAAAEDLQGPASKERASTAVVRTGSELSVMLKGEDMQRCGYQKKPLENIRWIVQRNYRITFRRPVR